VSKGVEIAGGATLIALLLGWYAATNLEEGASFAYYQTLEAFRAAPESDAFTRVHGYVVQGSIDRDVAARSVAFAVQNDPPHAGGSPDDALPVVYASLETPDLFKDGAEVVIEGRMHGTGSASVFHADRVMAKCPSKFEAAAEPAAQSPARSASF
jgi:cytochrome c-type biogenesis protein CcmE